MTYRHRADPGPRVQFLRERELAERWQKSPRTLQRWRAEGYGPAFIRFLGGIRYRLDDIEAFEERMRKGGEASS